MDKPGPAPASLLVERTRSRLLTVAEAAGLMRVSTDLICDPIRAGKFPAIRLLSRFVVPLRALQLLESDAMRARMVVDVAATPGRVLVTTSTRG